MKINTLISILFISFLFSNVFADTITEPIRIFSGHISGVNSVAFSPNGQYALSGSYDETLKLWDVHSGTEIRSFRGHTSEVLSVAFSPDGRYALSGSMDSTLKLWDVNGGTEIRTFTGHTSIVWSVAFSPNAQYALSGSHDKTLKLWDVNSGAEIRSFSGHTSDVLSVAFSPDGRYVLSGSKDATLRLWDVDSGAEIRTFTGHIAVVWSVDFSSDGRYVLSGSRDATLKLWDVNSGAEIRSFHGHTAGVTSVAFSPNARYVLSGDFDSTIKLWDVNSGAEIHSFRGHTDGVISVAFSPEARYALSGSRDKTLKLWDTGLVSPPTAAFSISTTHGEAPLTVTLDASSSYDSDGTIVSYTWTANGQHFASNHSVVSNTFGPGEYTIILTITDNQGLTATAQQHLSVTTPNQAPIAQFTVTPTQGQAPLTVTLDGSASYDLDGTVVGYSWWTSEGITAVGENPIATMTFPLPGTYTIHFAVSDNTGMGNTNVVQQTVIVTEAPKPPVAIFTALPNEGAAPLTVTLDASGSHDPDGSIVTYEWRINDALLSSVGTPDPFSFTFEHEGENDVILIVTDNQGMTATTQQHVSVAARPPPPPVASFTASPTQGQAPLTVTLDGSASYDPDGTVVGYSWWTSEGIKAVGENPIATMTFPLPGTYTIHFAVSDNIGMGNTNVVQQTVIVLEPIIEQTSGQAIIIAAGGAQPDNTLFEYSNDFTQRMYRLLIERGFSDDDIDYMNPQPPDIDLDGFLEDNRHDYKFFDPAQELSLAFTQAASKLRAGQQFVFFLHGHADPDHFLIMPNYELSASHLRDLLAGLPAGVQQILILDSCYSGSFFNELTGVANRILISSADDKTLAWNTEIASFTDSFLRSLRRGQNLRDAFQTAENMITGNLKLFREQQPWLDDDGDGQYTSSDGSRAAQIELGEKGIHAAPPPTITQVHERMILPQNETTATLWVRITPRHERIRLVRAVLVNPAFSGHDYQGLETPFGREALTLIYNPAQDRYEVVYDSFWTGGLWQIRYQAQNNEGVWSDIEKGEVQAPGITQPVTVKMALNQSRYTAAEPLRLDMIVNGKAVVDLYVAIVFPDGNFQTIIHPLYLSFNNTIEVYQSHVEITEKKTYPIMDLSLPKLPLGHYMACGVLFEAGVMPNLALSNWIDIDCPEFEVY